MNTNSEKPTPKRTKIVKIRLFEAEYNAMLERKTKAQLASWLRAIALDEPTQQPIRKTDPILLKELNKIGVNINQIAKYCNSDYLPDNARILIAVKDMQDKLNELLQLELSKNAS